MFKDLESDTIEKSTVMKEENFEEEKKEKKSRKSLFLLAAGLIALALIVFFVRALLSPSYTVINFDEKCNDILIFNKLTFNFLKFENITELNYLSLNSAAGKKFKGTFDKFEVVENESFFESNDGYSIIKIDSNDTKPSIIEILSNSGLHRFEFEHDIFFESYCFRNNYQEIFYPSKDKKSILWKKGENEPEIFRSDGSMKYDLPHMITDNELIYVKASPTYLLDKQVLLSFCITNLDVKNDREIFSLSSNKVPNLKMSSFGKLLFISYADSFAVIFSLTDRNFKKFSVKGLAIINNVIKSKNSDCLYVLGSKVGKRKYFPYLSLVLIKPFNPEAIQDNEILEGFEVPSLKINDPFFAVI